MHATRLGPLVTSYLLSTITQEGGIIILIVQVRRFAVRELYGHTAVNDQVRIHIQACLSSVCSASFEMVPLTFHASLCSASISHPQTLAWQSLLPGAFATAQETLTPCHPSFGLVIMLYWLMSALNPCWHYFYLYTWLP